MSWRRAQADWRRRYLALCDAEEARRYEALVGQLDREAEDACLSDLGRVATFRPGMRVLDVGAGTGALCKLLSRLDGLKLTALEPARPMLALLRSKPELADVRTVEGFCDAAEDGAHFREGEFDAVVSRQVANGLFDPLTAFSNWRHWLVAGGTVVLVDGLYGRDSWGGPWAEDVDVLPLSACQSTAMVPYLLERSGFRIESVARMETTNDLPSTRTPRYVVVATKPG